MENIKYFPKDFNTLETMQTFNICTTCKLYTLMHVPYYSLRKSMNAGSHRDDRYLLLSDLNCIAAQSPNFWYATEQQRSRHVKGQTQLCTVTAKSKVTN